MALGNAECSQTLAKQTNANLNMLQLYLIRSSRIAKIKGGRIKQRPVARYMDFANFYLPRNKGRP